MPGAVGVNPIQGQRSSARDAFNKYLINQSLDHAISSSLLVDILTVN